MFVKKEPTLSQEDSKKLAEVMEHMIATSDEMVKAVNQYRSEIVSDAGKSALLLSGIEEVQDDNRSDS